MAAADFPNAPSVNDVFSIGDKSWTWTGTVWQLVAGPAPRQSVGTTPPSSPVSGDQWFNSNTASQYVYYDGYWVEVGAPHRGATQPTAFRNRVVNGSFDVWQRGAGAFTTSGGVTADQWKFVTSGSTFSVTRQAFTLGNIIPGYEPAYYLRSVVTSVAGAANYAIIDHRIESVRTLAGQTATLSFWAKADTTRNMAVEFYQNFGTGGSPSADVTGISSQTLIPLTTSWQRYQVTVTIPSIIGKTLGTDGNDFLRIFFWLDGGSNYISRTANLIQQSGTFDFWGVQLEPGSYATEYENRPYDIEYARCQRYFQRWADPALRGVVAGTSTFSRIAMPIPSMRSAPVASTSGSFGFYDATTAAVTAMTIVAQYNRVDKVELDVTTTQTGYTTGRAAIIYTPGGSGLLDLTAEL